VQDGLVRGRTVLVIRLQPGSNHPQLGGGGYIAHLL
jgi:hypothetical protein